MVTVVAVPAALCLWQIFLKENQHVHGASAGGHRLIARIRSDHTRRGMGRRKTLLLKNPLPTIEDAAKFYARVTGVKAETFLATAKSFGVEASMRRADMLMRAYKVPSTPTIVVNGRYRLDGASAGGYSQLIELTKWLVAKESPPH